MNKKLALAAALVILVAAGSAYYYYSTAKADLPQVRTVKPVRAQIQAKVYTTGKIDLQNKQEVRVLNAGLVKSVPVAAGDRVKQGGLLLELDTKDLQLQVKQALASLDVARANLAAANNRVAQLQKITANPQPAPGQAPAGIGGLAGQLPAADMVAQTLAEAQSARRQAQALVNQAQAAVDLVRAQENNARINAALDGTVLMVNVAPGQPAAPQTPLLLVGDLEHLLVLADVNEVDAGKLSPGQQVKIGGATLGDREFNGQVMSVAPIAQSQPAVQGSQTTVTAKIQIDKADPALKPGFSVSLTVIIASKPNALQIPQEAVFTSDKVKYVYIVRQGSLVRKQISTGISGDVNTEVLTGVTEGDLIVLNPSKNLKEGLKVRVE